MLHARRKHGELGELDLPDREQNEEENGANDQRRQHVGVAPFVLVSSPLETGEEENHADDGETAADKVDFANDFLPAEATAVGAGRWEVEEESPPEADACPDAAEQRAIAPAGVGRDELGPEHGRAEWDDGEHQDGDVFASFTGRRQFRGDGQRGEFANASANAGESHAHCARTSHVRRSGKRNFKRLTCGNAATVKV